MNQTSSMDAQGPYIMLEYLRSLILRQKLFITLFSSFPFDNQRLSPVFDGVLSNNMPESQAKRPETDWSIFVQQQMRRSIQSMRTLQRSK